jgi:hypothetical protein
MTERIDNTDPFFIARYSCVINAVIEDYDVNNPNLQIAQWLRFAVAAFKQGVWPTAQLLQNFDKSGGTDHCDPTIYTSK